MAGGAAALTHLASLPDSGWSNWFGLTFNLAVLVNISGEERSLAVDEIKFLEECKDVTTTTTTTMHSSHSTTHTQSTVTRPETTKTSRSTTVQTTQSKTTMSTSQPSQPTQGSTSNPATTEESNGGPGDGSSGHTALIVGAVVASLVLVLTGILIGYFRIKWQLGPARSPAPGPATLNTPSPSPSEQQQAIHSLQEVSRSLPMPLQLDRLSFQFQMGDVCNSDQQQQHLIRKDNKRAGQISFDNPLYTVT